MLSYYQFQCSSFIRLDILTMFQGLLLLNPVLFDRKVSCNTFAFLQLAKTSQMEHKVNSQQLIYSFHNATECEKHENKKVVEQFPLTV